MNRIDTSPIHKDALDGLSEESKVSVERLAAFLADARLPDLSVSYPAPHLSHSHDMTLRRTPYPRNKLAAVLVLLYEDEGVLRILLTTRSKALRTHAGQTALPGGKADETDITLVETAVRCVHLLNSKLNYAPSFARRTKKCDCL